MRWKKCHAKLAYIARAMLHKADRNAHVLEKSARWAWHQSDVTAANLLPVGAAYAVLSRESGTILTFTPLSSPTCEVLPLEIRQSL